VGERLVEFAAAYDKRPKYGIHGVEMRMVLKYPDGAVQFLLFTNWHLPHVHKELKARALTSILNEPLAADLGYHSPIPQHDGQTSMGPCVYLDGRDCYYDGSGLSAEHIFKVLLEEGSAGVWRELEEFYQSVFHAETVRA